MPTNATPQTISQDGTVEEVDGRYTIRFERRFKHPIEKVWEAITTPERIKERSGWAKSQSTSTSSKAGR